jgi:hypothetical protein
MPDKEAEIRRLAEVHYQVEEGITHIFRITGSGDAELRPNEPIKLLEVNQNTIPSGIMPLQFDPVPADGIHFPAIIVEVTPDEYLRIRSSELVLPCGWTIGDLLPRPPENGGR